jgi:S1-C subfamily serine protease
VTAIKTHPSLKSFYLFSLLALLAASVAMGPSWASADDKPTKASEARVVAAPKNVDQLRAIETQLKMVAAKVVPCTVGLKVGPAGGSGVIVSEDGYVLTAGHVIRKPGQKIGISLGVYGSADAGLAKITDKGKYPFVEMGKSADLKQGAWVVAVGHPLGYKSGRPPVIRVGRILRAREQVIQTDCPLISGDSGGPLFDLSAKVIGINSRIGGPVSMNFHVPIDIFHKHWERLKKSEVWKDDVPGRDCTEVKAAFRKVIAGAGKCVIQIKCDGKDTVLGTIVGPDGWVLTKASELKGRVVCRLRDGRDLDARIVGMDPRFDLAVLKIDATDLPKIIWNLKKPAVGQWVATPGLKEDPLAVGVVSVVQRRIPPPRGSLGVVLVEGDGGVKLKTVLPKGPADKAGLKANDVITHVDGKPTKTPMELVAVLKQRRPGQVVKLTVKRGDKTLNVSVTLMKLVTPATRKRDLLNRTGGGISKRHDDFPVVLQHDTVLRPADCGSPLVDLDGKALGVNIARGGRTETYCVPAGALVVLMYDLMSGRLTPREKKAKAAKPELAKKPEPEKKPAPEKKPTPEKKADEEKAAKEKAAAEKAAKEKAAAEKAAKEKAAAEKKAAEEKAAREKAAAEKAAAEKKAAEEKAAKEKAVAEKKAAEEKAAEKKAAEKKAAEKKAAEKKAAEKKAAEKKAAEEKVAREKAAAEKAAAEKKAAEKKAAEEKVAREKAAAEKAAAEKKAAKEKAAAEKDAADKKAAEEQSSPPKDPAPKEKKSPSKKELEPAMP